LALTLASFIVDAFYLNVDTRIKHEISNLIKEILLVKLKKLDKLH